MVYCAVEGCKNRPDGKKLRFFTFPKDAKLCKEWIMACGKKKTFKVDCARICGKHFVQSDFKLQDILLKVPDHKRRLQHGAIPSENLPNKKRISKQEKKRKKLENKALVEECLANYERKQKDMQGTPAVGVDMQNNGAAANGCFTSDTSNVECGTNISSAEKRHHQEETRIVEYLLESICTADEDQPSRGTKLGRNNPNDLNSDNPSGICFADKPLEEHSYSQIQYFTNGSTQTDFDYGCCKEMHIMRLEAENRKLKLLIKKQVKRAQDSEVMRSSLRDIMTTGQINRLIHPGRKLKWRAEDISSAMSLYTAGPLAYSLLRKRNFPLPSSSTLRGWAGKIQINPGMLNIVFQLIKKLDYDEKDRLCVLCFDKIRLKASTYAENSNNTAMSRARYAHVVMVRGLVKDWMQIIYYDLDTPTTVAVLKSIIMELDGINFVVTAVVSVMWPTTLSMWKELNISENQPYFLHPSDEFRKIFFFVDVLHLVTLVRNRFVRTGFVLNGKTIDTGPIKEILDDDECKSKISSEHLEITNFDRRKVNYVKQLLSHSVSGAIKRSISLGRMHSSNACECADFIELFSEWFEVFNSKCASLEAKEKNKAYGLLPDVQNSVLLSMTETVESLKARKRHTVLHFQNAILLNNAALPEMLTYVNLNYNINCIMTNKLNHEELERFFSVIRSKGIPPNHPTPLEFKYRLRSSILGKMIL